MGKVLRFGEGVTVETEGETVPATSPVGTPAKPVADVPALTAQLGVLAQNALIAQNRLTNLVDPTRCADKVQALINRYGELQTRITGINARVQELTGRPDGAANVIRDGESVSIEVQGFIEAVEALISEYPRTMAQQSAPGIQTLARSNMSPEQKRKLMPFLLLGGMAVLVAGGGYMIWRQHDKEAKATARASKRAFGALPARGGRSTKLAGAKRK